LPTVPPTVKVDVFDTSWELIRERINLLVKNGIGGLVLVIGILYLFLPSRIAFWVVVGIPTAFLATLGLMLLFGGSINMISLFALIMALGIIVDDAIVVAEDADTQRRRGKGPADAALSGARRMFWPVVAASATTIAAFVPLMMVGGIIGNILFDIPFVMVMVISAALIESFLILPAHLKSALRGGAAQHASRWRQKLDALFEHFREQHFRPLVACALTWRGTTIAITLATMILAVGVIAGGRIGFVFFPTPESQVLHANVTFAAGTPREHTTAYLHSVEQALMETDEFFGGGIVHIAVSRVGGTIVQEGSPVSSGDHRASILVELVPSEEREVRNEAFLREWRDRVEVTAGLESLTLTPRQAGPPGRDLNVRLTGEDPARLKAAALALAESMRSISGVTDVEDDLPFGREQLIYRLTPAGEALGLTTESLGRQLRAAFDGHLAQLVQSGREELEVRVMLPRHERERLDVFERLVVQTPGANFVPLDAVARWESRIGFEALHHADGQLAVEVSGEIDPAQANADVLRAELLREVLPQLAQQYGVEFSFEGRAADQRETMQDMQTGLLLGLGLIYLTLVWAFASWSWPLVVMAAIPLGLVGAVFGHWLMGLDLTILSMFGLFALAGIVVNNSIILVSLFKELRDKGETFDDALIGAACGRLRAVMLTSLTTIVGLTPLLFESSLQAQFLVPMAASIAFGLGFSAILVLFFIPALLSVVESFKDWLAGGRMLRSHETP